MERRSQTPFAPPIDIRRPISLENPHIQVRLEDSTLRRNGRLLNKTYQFVQETSALMAAIFDQNYKMHNPESRALPLIRGLGLDAPKFTILDRPNARKFMDKADFAGPNIRYDSLLVVFQFPQIIARSNRILYGREKTKNPTKASKWKRFARPIKTGLWITADNYSAGADQLQFKRLNEIGKHDGTYYHYLIEVRNPSRPERRKRRKLTRSQF